MVAGRPPRRLGRRVGRILAVDAAGRTGPLVRTTCCPRSRTSPSELIGREWGVTDDDGSEVLDLGVVDERPSAPAEAVRPHRPAPRLAARRTRSGRCRCGRGRPVVLRSRDSTPPSARRRRRARRGRHAHPARARRRPGGHRHRVARPLLDGGRGWTSSGSGERHRAGRTRDRPGDPDGMPQLSDSPTFVPVRGGVLVHLGDIGATYVVPDGSGPQEAPRGLLGIGPMLPGPDLDHVWLVSPPGRSPRCGWSAATAARRRPRSVCRLYGNLPTRLRTVVVSRSCRASAGRTGRGASGPGSGSRGDGRRGRPDRVARHRLRRPGRCSAPASTAPAGAERCPAGRRRTWRSATAVPSGALAPDGRQSRDLRGRPAGRAARPARPRRTATGPARTSPWSRRPVAVAGVEPGRPVGLRRGRVRADRRRRPPDGTVRPLVPGTIVPAIPVVQEVAVR